MALVHHARLHRRIPPGKHVHYTPHTLRRVAIRRRFSDAGAALALTAFGILEIVVMIALLQRIVSAM